MVNARAAPLEELFTQQALNGESLVPQFESPFCQLLRQMIGKTISLGTCEEHHYKLRDNYQYGMLRAFIVHQDSIWLMLSETPNSNTFEHPALVNLAHINQFRFFLSDTEEIELEKYAAALEATRRPETEPPLLQLLHDLRGEQLLLNTEYYHSQVGRLIALFNEGEQCWLYMRNTNDDLIGFIKLSSIKNIFIWENKESSEARMNKLLNTYGDNSDATSS